MLQGMVWKLHTSSHAFFRMCQGLTFAQVLQTHTTIRLMIAYPRPHYLIPSGTPDAPVVALPVFPVRATDRVTAYYWLNGNPRWTEIRDMRNGDMMHLFGLALYTVWGFGESVGLQAWLKLFGLTVTPEQLVLLQLMYIHTGQRRTVQARDFVHAEQRGEDWASVDTHVMAPPQGTEWPEDRLQWPTLKPQLRAMVTPTPGQVETALNRLVGKEQENSADADMGHDPAPEELEESNANEQLPPSSLVMTPPTNDDLSDMAADDSDQASSSVSPSASKTGLSTSTAVASQRSPPVAQMEAAENRGW